MDYNSLDHEVDQTHQEKMKSHIIGSTSYDYHHDHNNNNQIVDYMLNNIIPPTPPDQYYHYQQHAANLYTSSNSSFDKLSFADVMQFADFGPKLALNQTKTAAAAADHEDETGVNNIDPVYFLKFPVLNDDHMNHVSQMVEDKGVDGGGDDDQVITRPVHEENNYTSSSMVQLRFLGEKNNINLEKRPITEANNKSNKRKRPRTIKTSEEVESQRMTHIAVERNRRKQMNEHLRVLRSLMPTSYVQRGDQASIIGGAIEFVRELEQLLQCLESQKRRRIYGDGQRPVVVDGDPSSMVNELPTEDQLMLVPPILMSQRHGDHDQQEVVEYETGEETAESKSCLADVEVKLLGFDALIKILSRRRPGQLINTIAALQDMHLNILHTNITTIEQTVLYSFNVKIGEEARFTAEDMANSVQQIFSFIHASSTI